MAPTISETSNVPTQKTTTAKVAPHSNTSEQSTVHVEVTTTAENNVTSKPYQLNSTVVTSMKPYQLNSTVVTTTADKRTNPGTTKADKPTAPATTTADQPTNHGPTTKGPTTPATEQNEVSTSQPPNLTTPKSTTTFDVHNLRSTTSPNVIFFVFDIDNV